MTFGWLPDAEQYANPRFSWLLLYLSDLLRSALFQVEHDLPDGFTPPAGALIISNHPSDADGPVLGTLLLQRRGLYLRGAFPFFAMREDLSRRWAMANLLCAWPDLLSRLLRPISLQWFFRNVRALPMRRVREFSWHDTLDELARAGLGGAHPADLFNRRGIEELQRGLGSLPRTVDAIDPWRLGRLRAAPWGLRRLRVDALRQLTPLFRATIDRQLQAFAQRLDSGHNVYFAPEGCVSLDGCFGRVRAGVWRLGRMTSKPLVCLPLTISYDPLRAGRIRALVRLGDPLSDPGQGDPTVLAHDVRQALATRQVVTPSHLLARYLLRRNRPFTASTLAEWLIQSLDVLATSHLALDPLFGRMTMPTLVNKRLLWLRRKGLVHRENGAWRTALLPDNPAAPGCAGARVQLLNNALVDLSPSLVEALPSCN